MNTLLLLLLLLSVPGGLLASQGAFENFVGAWAKIALILVGLWAVLVVISPTEPLGALHMIACAIVVVGFPVFFIVRRYNSRRSGPTSPAP